MHEKRAYCQCYDFLNRNIIEYCYLGLPNEKIGCKRVSLCVLASLKKLSLFNYPKCRGKPGRSFFCLSLSRLLFQFDFTFLATRKIELLMLIQFIYYLSYDFLADLNECFKNGHNVIRFLLLNLFIYICRRNPTVK